jgi:hypothetical protein
MLLFSILKIGAIVVGALVAGAIAVLSYLVWDIPENDKDDYI